MTKSKIVFLEEFQYVQELSKNVPEIIKILDKSQEMLYSHANYPEVKEILEAMDGARLSLQGLLEAYQIKLNGVNHNE